MTGNERPRSTETDNRGQAPPAPTSSASRWSLGLGVALFAAFLLAGFGYWRDWLLDVAATAMLSMSLLLLAGSALRLRRHRHGWLAAVLLLFLASLVGMGTIWSIARTPKVSDQVVTSADGIDMKLQVVQRRSLLRTDETVEVYATDNDMIERTWMVWRAAGRGPIQLRFSDAHQVEVVDGRGVVYRSDLSVGDFRPSPQRCLRTVRCGEAN